MEGFYQGQCAVLELIAGGAPLPATLDAIVRLIEREGAGAMACSLLLLDADGVHVRHGAAVGLPPEYVRILDGLPIGPLAGSCGAAMFLGQRVIVEDIATHPNWVDYRAFALPHGLRACWSTPVLDADGRVLGTFAMYYREPRGPTGREAELVAAATHLAAIAIVRDRTERALREREAQAVSAARELRQRVEELTQQHARRVEAEGALRRSEERLRAVIENTPDVAIQWYDEGGRLIFCNDATLSLFGWRGREVLGRRLVDLGFFDEVEEARFGEARALAAGDRPPPPFEFSFRRPDGSRGYLLSTVFRIPHQTESCYVCMDVDLTDRRRMEEAVRAGEALRATIYASVVDPIFCLAAEPGGHYRFLSVNPAFLRATGLAEGDVVGRTVAEVIPEPSRSLVLSKYREAIEARREVHWEEVTSYPSGTRHGEVTICPIFDGDGGCTLVGTVHDITRLRQAEVQRRALEAQLQQNQRLQSLGTLASGIAHDFNNVLAAIAANVELALDPGLAADAADESLREVQKATRRAAGLVRQILAFGRKQEARRERADLKRVLDEALGLLRATLPTQVQISTRFSPEALETLIDPTQLHQIVMNLVTNASHAIQGAGTIEVTAMPYDHAVGAPVDLAEGRYVRVSVRDTGHGMDEATLGRVFDPFFTTKPAGEGTGLGLSIVHGIVRSHGGAVAVSSRLGEGTTFDLYFPLLGPEADATATVVETPGHGERVMLVDDEEAIVFLGTRILTKLGYHVSGHANPNRALDEFRAAPDRFDAVISDVSMSGMSGVALLGEVRRLRPEIPVILTSGHVRPEDVAAARTYGLGEPIPKPHTVEEFAWAVSRRLRERASSTRTP